MKIQQKKLNKKFKKIWRTTNHFPVFLCDLFLFLGNFFVECSIVWVTRPERPKGAKDKVKQAQRAQSRPEGPHPRRPLDF